MSQISSERDLAGRDPIRDLLDLPCTNPRRLNRTRKPSGVSIVTRHRYCLPRLPRSPAASSSAVRSSMIGNSTSQSRPEKKLQEALVSLGLSHFMVHAVLPGTPDLTFEAEKIAVFVHGCYWHRCPYCKPHFPASNQHYWTAKFARNKARDKAVRRRLKGMNWKVVTVWECKLLKDSKRQARRVRKWVLENQMVDGCKETVPDWEGISGATPLDGEAR